MSRLPAVRPAVRSISSAVIEDRRTLHAWPELSWKETQTQRFILDQLAAIGLEDVRPIAKTGATALFRGNGRGCVAWRADIDGLPIPERSGLPFASRNNGVMHACGHDVHAAIALGIARVLQSRHQDDMGSVRFIFQPAEEAAGGAPACIAEGVLESPQVSRVLGMHISADIPVGTVNVAPGPFFAMPTFITVEIQGRGGHGAAPQQAVDAVVVAAHVITALQTVVSRSSPPSEPAVLTIGTVQAGFRSNVIAESAMLTGTIRSYTNPMKDHLVSHAEQVVAGVCAAFGATARFEHSTSCPPVVNDETLAALVAAESQSYFGPGSVVAAPSMGADDMADFLQARPGVYFWFGARNEQKGIAGRHHDPGFVIDEDAIPHAVEFGLRLIERTLAL